ncbi:MAG: hypothetical protein BroJett030_30400 [Alphaproteobacteria bacterium]|nr:MAG: hypothetical protein BroJett030_30400 [Alphaproteobacteria bacterium]
MAWRMTRLLLAAAIAALLQWAAPAQAAVEPGPGKGWLMIASRTNVDDAIALARRYSGRFPGVVVFHSSTGYYGVALGWGDIARERPLLQSLISAGDIPADSYFTAGARLIRAVWSASNAHTYALPDLLAATRLPAAGPPPASQPPAPAGQPGYVTGLNPQGDNFLSLRTGPGTGHAEIARMLTDTPVTIIGSQGSWYRVSLANGMTGWAHSRYIARGTVPTIGPSRGDHASAPPVVGPEQAAPPPPEGADPGPPAPPVAAVADQKRVALVIGNSAYRHTLELPNPRNDAEAMAAKLRELGFTVIKGLDGSKADMEASVREFVRAMAGADVALFFYAGHGMQVSGRNYLIPVDAELEDATALDFETIGLDAVINFMSQEGRLSIVLLDACRDNPLSRRFARSLGATRSAFIGRGLAAPSTAGGQVLIGFATAPGEVALDGDGSNSPFTTALIRHIGSGGLEIELMLKRVKQDVFEATGQQQEPWHNSALRREFYFNPG